MSNRNKITVLNKELISERTEDVVYKREYDNRVVKQRFTLENTHVHKNSFVGLYRDIIENVDTGDIEIRTEQNDITELFQKLIQFRLFIDYGILDRLDYDKYFNMDVNDIFFQKIREIKTNLNEYNIKNYLGIHSWEIGNGYPEWDKVQDWNFEYNEYGFTVKKGTVEPYSSLKIYNETLLKLGVDQDVQTFYSHNSLICRTPYLSSEISNITFDTNNHPYIQYSLRKPVQVFFVVPTQYYVDENTIITDTVEILTNLKNGKFIPERVIEWLPYTQKHQELNFPQSYTKFMIPEFIMVQQIFEPYEQNFEWREFGILQGFNLTQNGITLEKSVEEPNVSLLRYMELLGISQVFSEVQSLFYPHGTMIDYKVHQVLRKNRNMRITRQMIFGVLNISSIQL